MGVAMAGGDPGKGGPSQTEASLRRKLLLDIAVILLWMTLTTVMVMYNKWLLSFFGFAFPISLTLWHMVFCSVLAAACIWAGLCPPLDIPTELYLKRILPIAACYAGSLWASNRAYSLCSVSFAQMIKAGLPVIVFMVGLVFGTERYKLALLIDLVVITLGVVVSAYGEAELVVEALLLLLVSMSLEATRLTLLQQMIQSSGLRFNPLTTLYYVAPPASAFLAIPFMLLEMHPAAQFVSATKDLWHFFLNAANAFGLNLAVFLLIGRTSALTLNICGLMKDWLTIALSVFVLGSTVTATNMLGYAISFCGVGYYNYLRMPQTQTREAPKEGGTDEQTQQDYKRVAGEDEREIQPVAITGAGGSKATTR